MTRYTAGRDIDLDTEPIYLNGERVDEARARELAEETLAEAERRGLRPCPVPDEYVVHLADGRRLTEDLAEQLAAEGGVAAAQRRGLIPAAEA